MQRLDVIGPGAAAAAASRRNYALQLEKGGIKRWPFKATEEGRCPKRPAGQGNSEI